MHLLRLLITFSLMFSSSLVSAQDLDQFLDLDRFHYYAQDMSANLHKKGFTELAEALKELSPEEIWESLSSNQQNLAKLKDAHEYDALLQKLVKARHPNIQQLSEINSNYNFFKNKLNASFTFRRVEGLVPRAPLMTPTNPKPYKIPSLGTSPLTLDADIYIANRQTRALIWDVIKNGRNIEFYVQPLQEALTLIEARGGTVVGEVQTLANNYNKNYLVHYPETNTYAHVITDISGTDRLHHLTKQLSVVKWGGVSGEAKLNGTVDVLGPLDNLEELETKRLKSLMEVLPKADHVVLGQKGAMERNIRTAVKVDKIMQLMETSPQALEELDLSQKKLIEQVQESGDLFGAMAQASKWDGIYAQLEDRMPPMDETFDFNLDLNSHSIADVQLRTKTGAQKRFRLISNVWGNEASPIAEALVATGHTNFTYIGTAGTLNSEYKVGDLVSPSQVQLKDGSYLDLPDPVIKPAGLKKAGRLGQVASLFDESHAWLLSQKQLGNDLVEMEVGYLAEKIVKKQGTKLNVFLLVSDAVGEEGETLDQASSSVRKKSQLNALSSVFEHEKIAKVVPISDRVGEDALEKLLRSIDPSRNSLALFHVRQKIIKDMGTQIPTAQVAKKYLDEAASFTPAALQKRLETVRKFLSGCHKLSTENQAAFKVLLDDGIFDGTYHPKQKFKIVFDSASSLSAAEIENLLASSSEFKQAIELEVKAIGNAVPITHMEIPRIDVLEVYNNKLLSDGGLMGKLSQKGNLSYSKVPMAKNCNINLLGNTGVFP